MRSVDVAYYEKQHLISWRRTEDNLVGYLKELYFNMRYSGCYVCRKTFRIHRKGIPTIQLLLTLEGEGRMRYREKDYCLTPGSAMLISLSEMHEYHAVTDGWKFKYLQFCGGMSNEYLAYIDMQLGPVFTLRKSAFSDIEEHMDAIFRETDSVGIPDYPAISSHIYSILTSFLSPKNSIGAAQKSAAAIHQAAAYITENFTKSISTQEIADAVYLSRSYMSEQFVKIYGVSPHEYLTMYRLSHVKKKLTTTTASISEIAELTGFRDVFALSRVFRQKYGISPSEYRKQMRG